MTLDTEKPTNNGFQSLLPQFSNKALKNKRALLFKGGISALVGVFVGIIVSMVVNSTLVEISMSAFFATYFGVLFISVGLIIIWRVYTQPVNTVVNTKSHLIYFAGLIIFSGILCFLLEKNWFVHTSWLFKVPIYTILGVAISFALIFSIVDFINYVLSFVSASFVNSYLILTKPLIESQLQVYTILGFAIFLGAVFGFVFGVLDVEDEIQYQIRLALLREEHVCYPIGALFGGIAGFLNEYIRLYEIENMGVGLHSEFDDDI